MTAPRKGRGDRAIVALLVLIGLAMAVWASIRPGEGAPVSPVHQGRLG